MEARFGELGKDELEKAADRILKSDDRGPDAELLDKTRNANKLAGKIKAVSEELYQELEREPTVEEITKKLAEGKEGKKVPIYDIVANLEKQQKPFSLENPSEYLGDKKLELLIADLESDLDLEFDVNKKFQKEDLAIDLQIAFNNLQFERHRDVLNLFYGLGGKSPLTVKEIAAYYDLSVNRVGQIKSEAIRELGKGLKGELLKPHVR